MTAIALREAVRISLFHKRRRHAGVFCWFGSSADWSGAALGGGFALIIAINKKGPANMSSPGLFVSMVAMP